MNDLDRIINDIQRLQIRAALREVQRDLDAQQKRLRSKWYDGQMAKAQQYKQLLDSGNAFIPAGTKTIVIRGK